MITVDIVFCVDCVLVDLHCFLKVMINLSLEVFTNSYFNMIRQGKNRRE